MQIVDELFMRNRHSRARELLTRYAQGERRFPGINLCRAVLEEADLRGIDLTGAKLIGAELFKANLRDAKLVGAQLARANLCGANLSGAQLVRTHLQGALLTAADLTKVNLAGADLTRAEMAGIDLRAANLTSARLQYAVLTASDLSHAKLLRADLVEANLSGARLQSCDLSHANLTRTRLREADLRGARLESVRMDDATLADCVADQKTRLSNATLTGVDLTLFCRTKVAHSEPSVVDFRSILASIREPRLRDFLRESGMPDVFVEYMVDCARSLNPAMVYSLLQSTFISYGGPDQGFAKKLNGALQRQGVRTFFFRDHAPAGERLHRVMHNGINDHDRVILVCSKASLERPGVLNELEETLAREARDGGSTYLLPIRLDDYVLEDWKPRRRELARAVRDRVIADFTNYRRLESFNRGVAKLIAILKQPVNPPSEHFTG